MKHKIVYSILIVTIILVSGSDVTAKEDYPILIGSYLGQKPPGMTPEIFAHGIVCTDLDEYGCTFSPDGKQFYFTRTFLNPRKHVIMVSKLEEKGWTRPQKVSFTENHSQGEPQFSPDGKKLFFGRLERGDGDKLIPFIWVAHHRDGLLSEPKRLKPGMYATASLNGNLYYTDVSHGMEKGDIVVSSFLGGRYLPAKILGGGLNSSFQDAHPFVAVDESYVIFDSNRPGGLGNNDLYVCFRNDDGSWGEAINLGIPVNSDKYDAIPSISPDGKYLFFSRAGDIYWVDSGFIEELKPDEFPVLRGPYLGQKPPGMTPEIFAPSIISIDGYEELCSGFMDDGKVFIFSRLKPGEDWKKKPTYWMIMKEEVWSKPIEVPFNDLHPYNFSVAPDDTTLYFTSNWSGAKPRKILKNENLWKVKYINGIWGEPEKLGPEINTNVKSANYPSVTQNGTIYYMKHDPNGYGKMDLVYHKLVGNKYGKLMNIGAPINTHLNELDPYIAPDERFLIFLANYEDSRGSWDLYISFKKPDGKWTHPINMGDDINTSAWESRPYVTSDGKYLFFSRGEENPSWADIFWVDAKIIEDLKPKETK